MQCAWPHEAVLDRTRQRGTNQRGTSQGGTQHRMRRTPADRTRRAYGPNETHLRAGFNTHTGQKRRPSELLQRCEEGPLSLNPLTTPLFLTLGSLFRARGHMCSFETLPHPELPVSPFNTALAC